MTFLYEIKENFNGILHYKRLNRQNRHSVETFMNKGVYCNSIFDI